jgi:hypothetical protein
MSTRIAMAIAIATVLPARDAAATAIGIDAGTLVWNGEVQAERLDAVASTGAAWVRVNFRLDVFAGPEDPGFLAAYDQIVDGFLARGISVYGLINDEAVASDAPRDSSEFVGAYVGTAVAIVDHFKDRVRVWELFNEPNDWAGGSSARLPAWRFAELLQETYLAIKHHGGHAADPCWQVTLLSGPLFSFDGVTGAEYLADTYWYGRNTLAWDWTHEATGRYPLDGVGYHLYVGQGLDSSRGDVAASLLANLDAVDAVVRANEGSSLPIWISELGWRADVVGADEQAERLALGMSTLAAHPAVAGALYFQLQDFPDNEWGVFAGGGLDAAHRRPAADRVGEAAWALRPDDAAHVLGIAGPDAIEASTSRTIAVTLENRGAATWPAGGAVRVGAASGCPSATTTNQLVWEPIDGYATDAADARAFLPAEVAPGEAIEVAIPVRAPATPGTYRFAARMVDEGVAWFGTTGSLEIAVAPDDGDPSNDPDPLRSDQVPPPGDGDGVPAGCSATRGTDGAVAIVLVLVLVAIRPSGRRPSSAGSCRRPCGGAGSPGRRRAPPRPPAGPPSSGAS